MTGRAFFSRRLDPVLDGAGRCIHAVVAPHAPGSEAVGQAVLNDGSHGEAHDFVRVASARGGEVGDVGEKIFFADGTKMLRNGEMNNAGLSSSPERVELSQEGSLAIGFAIATRTLSALVISAARDDFRFWQIFWSHDSFGGIGDVSSWRWHNAFPLSDSVLP